MTYANLFQLDAKMEAVARINQLTAETQPQWGKMSVAQMLAHLCVAYEMALEDTHPRPNFIARFLLKTFIKKSVVGPEPYPKNGRTAPAFIISDQRDFEKEKARLLTYMDKTQSLGEKHFHNKESNSFGPLTKEEWNVLFSKHLDHHLRQFGV